MEPIRKHFGNELPFTLLLDYKETKSPQRELPDHQHDWYEIIYVYGGKGSFFIDQTFYEMRQGDVIVVPGNTVHRGFPDNEEPVTSSAVFFSPGLILNQPYSESYAYLKLFDAAKQNKQYKYTLSPEHAGIVQNDIDAIHNEREQNRTDGGQALTLLLHLTLLHLNRYCLPQTAGPLTSNTLLPDWFREALSYINDHLNQPLELSSLAGRAAISPAHFSRVFKQRLGMNVTDYIATKRIFAAKDSLLQSSGTIEQIAMACGFESMPHFYRTFKKITTVTPAAYRRNSRTH
ncbi:AraC family transcriptional regulator [Paenibacillus tritici]|uniref:AraC family transcriptional regulator n=1 Tax=Paenibacillus tritici TaxID=1873425 RepID=A0ABX2DX06_9BACL|nr:AraC family transcriptional regulator [Paenibacillus tritici]NQX47946.1 AraC family transcriptional regulator [Paenibacillus tritici]